MIRPSAAAGVLAFALGVAAASATAAQTWTAQPPSDNWDAAAVAQWDSGAAMTALCHNGEFRLSTQLAAPMEGLTATVSYAFDEGEARSVVSALTEDGQAVFARFPAEFARELMSSRSLDMTIGQRETPPQRYVLDTPGQPEVLGEVLTACGQPLVVAARPSAILITNPDWIERPTGTELGALYPDRALRARINGSATVQCIVAVDGRLKDCLPLTEEPEGQGFGAAAIAATPQYRLHSELADGEPVAGGLVNITINWTFE